MRKSKQANFLILRKTFCPHTGTPFWQGYPMMSEPSRSDDFGFYRYTLVLAMRYIEHNVLTSPKTNCFLTTSYNRNLFAIMIPVLDINFITNEREMCPVGLFPYYSSKHVSNALHRTKGLTQRKNKSFLNNFI